MTKYFPLRGKTTSKPDYVLKESQLFYGIDTKSLYVGDGETQLCDLKGINNICKAPNGKLYIVSVDNDGVAHAKPFNDINGKFNMEFYADPD